MIRDDIKQAQIAAMKAGDKDTRAAIGLIQAAIKNRDIEARTAAQAPDDDSLVVEVLQKMKKQRIESIQMFRSGGREELAAAEEAEVAVIDRFLPKQMDEAETAAYENVCEAAAAIAGDGPRLRPRPHGGPALVQEGDAGHSGGAATVAYVDLALLHWPAPMGKARAGGAALSGAELRAATWRGLQRAYAEGVARAIGVSNFTTAHLEELLAAPEEGEEKKGD